MWCYNVLVVGCNYYGILLEICYADCCVYTAGVGQVLNLMFGFSFSAIVWDPPAGPFGSLLYQVTLIDMSNYQVILSNTTTDTSYPLSDDHILPCQQYKAEVFASISTYNGTPAVIVQRSPGGE